MNPATSMGYQKQAALLSEPLVVGILPSEGRIQVAFDPHVRGPVAEELSYLEEDGILVEVLLQLVV